MGQRLKGQDVVLAVTTNGGQQAQFVTDIRNFELTPKFEKLEEQYLGQTSKKYDDIFHGVDFKFDMHLEKSSALAFVELIKQRAQSRAGSTTRTTVNIKATLNFPDGQVKTITLSDCSFEDMPLSIGGRSEYAQFTLSGSCTDISGIGSAAAGATAAATIV